MITGLFFIVLGAIIKYGKMYFLIAGYNTMSKEEKANYNIQKAAVLFFKVFLYMGIISIIGDLLAESTQIENLGSISMFFAVLSGIPYLLYKSN